MPGLFRFIKYNNAVPIAVSLMLLGAGGAFAATDPQAIYNTTQTVVSIDNSYLVNKDLSSYSPSVVITGVSEDAENYYVSYTLLTIDLKDYAWQDVQRSEVMQVSKPDLGPYRDLGLYVTDKLKNVVSRELDRLVQTQADAKTHPSSAQVVTEYSGLVGKFLNTKTDVLPGYTPVVSEPAPTPAIAQSADQNQNQNQSPPAQGGGPVQPPAGPSIDPGVALPTLQLLGESAPTIHAGDTYVDLGAAVTGPTPSDRSLAIDIFLDSTKVKSVSIDTSAVGTHSIVYEATNAGGTATVTRTLTVVPAESVPAPTPAPDTTPPDTATSSPPDAPAPAADAPKDTSGN